MLLCEFVSYCFNYYLCNILIIKFNIHFILNCCKEIHFYIVCCYYGCLLLMKTIKVLKSDYRVFTFIIKIDVSWNGIKIAVFVRSCEIAFSVIHILHENHYLILFNRFEKSTFTNLIFLFPAQNRIFCNTMKPLFSNSLKISWYFCALIKITVLSAPNYKLFLKI